MEIRPRPRRRYRDVTKPRFLIVGGGPGGTVMAAYLARAGYEVDVYERRPDMRRGPVEAGRSINLALSLRGIHALREIGLADDVLRVAIPMRGRMIHAPDGHLAFQHYGKDDSEAINSVSRGGLNIMLLDHIEKLPGVRLHFDQQCVDVDFDAPAAEFLETTTGRRHRVAADILIGADGAFSAVRAQMQRRSRFDYAQSYLAHGYKELTMPAAPGGGFAMEKHALHIWPRRSFMMIALPNFDGSYTCTLFWPFDGPDSFAALRTREQIDDYFRRVFPDAPPLMPTLADDFLANPTGAMVTVRCRPWTVAGRVALLGDAAHAVVPFYGQGMNAAFEDCTVLNECITRLSPDWPRVFAEYERLRKENVDALADLAIENFVEMRDRTGSRLFLLGKRLERQLHRLFPRAYLPLYTMVTFTRIPYAEARRRARRQNRVVAAAAAALLLLLAVWLFVGLI